ncbi:MAG: hypothetical protein JST54_22315 [Deltaproteobacteria bacterium]|nr:hypothetical protein [Deltaproteobacteria bacterium]
MTRRASTRMTWKRWLIAAAVAIPAVVAGGLWFLIRNVEDGLCGSTPIRKVPSPSGSRSIVIYERDCGATTRAALNISLGAATALDAPNESGNVLVGDDGHDASVPLDARITWESECSASDF